MKKITILIVSLTIIVCSMCCGQNNPAYNASAKNSLKYEAQSLPPNEADMSIFLKAMNTDSMIEKLELLSKFINTNADNNTLDEYTTKALAFTNLKLYDSALLYFTLAINLDSRDPYLYYFRGDTYTKKHNFQKAIEDFSSAIHFDPNFYMAYYYRGICYYAMGNVDKAMCDLSRTFKLVKASMKAA